MKTDLRERTAKLRAGLQTILDKSFYEQEREVQGVKIKMHILTKGEEAEISKLVGSLDLISREHQKSIETLAHAISEINGIAFENLEEAREFFSLMSMPLVETLLREYGTCLKECYEALPEIIKTLKN